MSQFSHSNHVLMSDDTSTTRIIQYDEGCVILALSESTLEYHRNEILEWNGSNSSSSSSSSGSNSNSRNSSDDPYVFVHNNSDNNNSSRSSDQNSNMSSSDEDTSMVSSDEYYDGGSSDDDLTEGRVLIGDGLSRSDDGDYFLVCHMCNFYILHYTNDFHWCACFENVKLSVGEVRAIKDKHWIYHSF